MRWPLPFLRPFPPRSPSSARRPMLFEASSVLCSLLRPSGPALAPRLPEPTRDRRGGCGRPEVSQVPTRSLTARTGLRWSNGPSQNGPAHVACGSSQCLGLHDIEFFRAQYSPRRLAVYASRPSSPTTPQHSLPGGRYPLPEPDFHRLDRASFAWRTRTVSMSGLTASTSRPAWSPPPSACW